MERKTKEMIFGAAIIISLVVIFIPYVLNGQLRIGEASSDIPQSPVWAEKHKIVPQPKEMANFKNQALKPHQTPVISDKLQTWVVSAGVYQSSQEAEKWLKTLQDKKLPAYLKIDTTSKSSPQYWVLVGPKLQKSEAQTIVKQLKQDNIEAELKTYHPNMALD
jgi:cell division septation protein DedD